MYTFEPEVQYQGKYLSITSIAQSEKDTVLKLQDLIQTVKNSTHPEKKEIFTYLNKYNIYFRLKKKYIKIDYEKLKTAIKQNASDIIDDMNADFKEIFDIATTKTSEEPLILQFPYIENAPEKSYFVKTKNHINFNKTAVQKEISIALERLHRVSRSIQDEYIIFYVQELFSCPQLEEFLNTNNYVLNYNLIYKNLEDMDPYAFENMEKELMTKLTKSKIAKDSHYLPNNNCFKISDNMLTPLTDLETNTNIDTLKLTLNKKVENTTLNAFCPFFTKEMVKIALKDLYSYLDEPKTKLLIRSGELTLKLPNITKDFGTDDSYHYSLISSAINIKFCISEINAYYDYIKIDNLSMNAGQQF